MAEHKNQVVIAEILVSKGEEIFKQSDESVVLTKNEEANEILKNIEEYPHAFVLACIMDRKIKDEIRKRQVTYLWDSSRRRFFIGEFSEIFKIQEK